MPQNKRNDEFSLLKALSKKQDCRIQGSDILVLSRLSQYRANDMGNGTWGKVDALTRHHGYRQVFVKDF